MNDLKDEIKINCPCCEKEIYVKKDTHNCPYCKYVFTEGMLGLLFANLNMINNNLNNSSKTISESELGVKDYIDPDYVTIQCGACGNNVSINSSAYICPFCKGSFTSEAFNYVLDFYKKGGTLIKLTPNMNKKQAVGGLLVEIGNLLNTLGNLGCLLFWFIPFCAVLYFLWF